VTTLASLESCQAQELVDFATNGKYIFLRVEPQSELLRVQLEKVFGKDFRKASQDVQPREILMLDITKDEEALLAAMKPKTRYNIRLAEKHGIESIETRDERDCQDFFGLLAKTAARKDIHFHPQEYYQKFLEHFDRATCELLVAKKGSEVLAGILILYFQNTAYYLHGGSSDGGRKYMAPHLLQWEAIRRAKARSMKQYDLGGVAVQVPAPLGKDWEGITRFKQGFAPTTNTLLFPGAYDIVIDRMRYTLYRFLRTLKALVS
jgi:lipid II:glycine glycyltransferase (peptidoglycan interpeptide bridge formation enzyme)